MYIYMCVCVCVCVFYSVYTIYFSFLLYIGLKFNLYISVTLIKFQILLLKRVLRNFDPIVWIELILIKLCLIV